MFPLPFYVIYQMLNSETPQHLYLASRAVNSEETEVVTLTDGIVDLCTLAWFIIGTVLKVKVICHDLENLTFGVFWQVNFIFRL